MRKEFKMKKALASIVVLSMIVTSVTNFSAFAADENVQNGTEIELLPSVYYTVTIPQKINLEEILDTGTNQYYAKNDSTVDKVSVSGIKGLNRVGVGLWATDYEKEGKLAIANASDKSDKKAINVSLGGTSLNGIDQYNPNVLFYPHEKDDNGDIVKYLSIETEKYDKKIEAKYTGKITFYAKGYT